MRPQFSAILVCIVHTSVYQRVWDTFQRPHRAMACPPSGEAHGNINLPAQKYIVAVLPHVLRCSRGHPPRPPSPSHSPPPPPLGEADLGYQTQESDRPGFKSQLCRSFCFTLGKKRVRQHFLLWEVGIITPTRTKRALGKFEQNPFPHDLFFPFVGK